MSRGSSPFRGTDSQRSDQKPTSIRHASLRSSHDSDLKCKTYESIDSLVNCNKSYDPNDATSVEDLIARYRRLAKKVSVMESDSYNVTKTAYSELEEKLARAEAEN